MTADVFPWCMDHVVVVGGGRQGVAAAQLLSRRGVKATIVDDGPRTAIEGRLEEKGVSDVLVMGGGIQVEATRPATCMVVSAGVPRAHPAIVEALALGCPVITEIDLASSLIPHATFIGITGTNGKSTTTTMLGSIARSHDADAFVGGNLGAPLSEHLAENQTPNLVVLELSSYQLETLSVPRFQSALVTNLTPDHLDRYASVDAYYYAKARLFSLIKDEGGSAINAGDVESRRVLHSRARGRVLDFAVDDGADGVAVRDGVATVRQGASVFDVSVASPHIIGAHNLENAAAALAAAALANIPVSAMTAGIAAYNGIAHRLEFVAEINGVRFFNDSKATNVDAAIKAVESFSTGVHLIVGGRGKGSPYEPLVRASAGRVKGVYTLGEDAPTLQESFHRSIPVVECHDLKRAFGACVEAAQVGDTVLLAPACASFDQWTSYEARGAGFRRLVEEHQQSKGRDG